MSGFDEGGKPLGLKGEINIYILTHDINSFKKAVKKQ